MWTYSWMSIVNAAFQRWKKKQQHIVPILPHCCYAPIWDLGLAVTNMENWEEATCSGVNSCPIRTEAGGLQGGKRQSSHQVNSVGGSKRIYRNLSWDSSPPAFPWYHELYNILNKICSLDKLQRILSHSKDTESSLTLWILKMLERPGEWDGEEVLFSHLKPKEWNFERITWRELDTCTHPGVWPMTVKFKCKRLCLKQQSRDISSKL